MDDIKIQNYPVNIDFAQYVSETELYMLKMNPIKYVTALHTKV